MVGTVDEKTAEYVCKMQETEQEQPGKAGYEQPWKTEQEITPLSFHQLTKARSYMDWVTAAVLGEETPIKVEVASLWDVELENHAEEKGDEIARDVFCLLYTSRCV